MDCEECQGRGYKDTDILPPLMNSEDLENAICACGRKADCFVGKEAKCALCEAVILLKVAQ
jgi:hypothetical protein